MKGSKFFKILKKVANSIATYWTIKGSKKKSSKKKASKGLRRAFKHNREKFIGE